MGKRRADAEHEYMDAHRELKIKELKAQLDRGDYRVNPGAVAEAVMRRAAGLDLAIEYAAELRDAAPTPKRSQTRLVGLVSARHTRSRTVAAVGV
jgi:Anti-sigma-28 factor, FlgM